MDLKPALKEQYHAALAMLAECVEKCPDDLWTTGPHPRPYWRIAWHAAYFTHNYLVQNEEAFNDPTAVSRWPEPVREALGIGDTQKAVDVEPYELPENSRVLSKPEMLEYFAHVDSLIDPTIDSLDLDAAETGFSWYKEMNKLSHELMNLRHIQGHVGQLSELLMVRGIDTGWIGKASART